MKPGMLVWLMAALAWLLCGPAAAEGQKWVEVKDAKELRALVSNKTMRGNGWFAHYYADGSYVLTIQDDPNPRRGTWQVTDHGQICCTRDGEAVYCYRYRRSTQKKGKYSQASVRTGTMWYFTLEDGVPAQ